jgi:hypothetical protein
LHISSRKYRSLSLLRFAVSFLQNTRFCPEDRWYSRNSVRQDVAVPPQNTGVGVHVFRCYLLCIFLGFFLVGYVPLLVLLFLPLQSTVVVLVILTVATYPSTSHLSSLIVSFLRLIFLDPLSPSKQGFRAFIFLLEFFLAQKSSLDRAPRRGEGRVIELLGVWMTQWFRRQSTSFGIYAFNMHWCFTCFASSDDVTGTPVQGPSDHLDGHLDQGLTVGYPMTPVSPVCGLCISL